MISKPLILITVQIKTLTYEECNNLYPHEIAKSLKTLIVIASEAKQSVINSLLEKDNNIDYIHFLYSAKVAELVDALDLGSSVIATWGFDSPLSHNNTYHFRGEYWK